ncbi:MAG: S9 family peptidase, partial [bacterium]|nr:S9 family peptidase [bacterium]
KKDNKEKELELWELRDKLREKKEENKVKRSDLYPGVSGYAWSKKASELIFEYRGDLFRYFPAEDRIVRLTMSDENESIVSYTPDGKGYYYTSHSAVYRVMFNSSYIHQLNHKLDSENKYHISSTDISPDGKWMLIEGSKREGKTGYKNVLAMSYKDRFAKAVKINRQVADDKRNQPFYRFYLRRITKTAYQKEPEHIFQIPGGDVWYEYSDIEWTKDSSKYAFMTWEREKGYLKIWVGKTAEGEKPAVLFEMKETAGFKSFFESNIEFTPDGKSLAAVINNTDGFRQPVIFDVKSGKKRSLVEGKFESFPILGFSKDGKDMYLGSDKVSPAHHGVYKLSLQGGALVPVARTDGMHRTSVISHNCRWLASNFGNWDKMSELFLYGTTSKKETLLTDSHKKGWEKYYFLKPEIFTYKNRNGETISGMIFKPKGWKPEDKRPGIVYLYGGPLLVRHTVESDNFSTLANLFQMLMAAKHGFVTINIDPRGQSGYGKGFSEANFENVGNPQVQDLEDLVKHINSGFGVDTKQLGLHGWSFGGYQTLKTMVSSPKTFACGIAVASVTEWENYNSWYAGSTIGKSVRSKPTLRKYSLIPHAHKLMNPLLMVHGMMDPNVLYQDTVRMYNAFLAAGKETLVDLFLDPEGTHSLEGTVMSKGVFKKFESWFLRHLKQAK